MLQIDLQWFSCFCWLFFYEMLYTVILFQKLTACLDCFKLNRRNQRHKLEFVSTKITSVSTKMYSIDFVYIWILKGTVSRNFLHSGFFYQSTPPRALIHGLKPFRAAHGFVFVEIIDLKIAKIGFRSLNETAGSDFFCQSSPLIFTFSSTGNYMCVMFTYLFVFPMEMRANTPFR
jgi:hypothetical protein